jgi:hypothetical protein
MNKRPGNSQQLPDRLEQNQLSEPHVGRAEPFFPSLFCTGQGKKSNPTLKSIESMSNIEPYGPAVVGSI